MYICYLLLLTLCYLHRHVQCTIRNNQCSLSTANNFSFENSGLKVKVARTNDKQSKQSIDNGCIKVTPLPKYLKQGNKISAIFPSTSISMNVIISNNDQSSFVKANRENTIESDNDIDNLLTQFCGNLQLTSSAISRTNMTSISKKNALSVSLLQSIDIILLPDDVTSAILNQYVTKKGDFIIDVESLSSLSSHQLSSYYALYIDFNTDIKPGIELSSFAHVKLLAFHSTGIQHGLNTLSQLFSQSQMRRNFRISPYSPISMPVLIRDWPLNLWRGLLVDVSRHFIPITLLKRCIRAMAALKLNVLHLHLTDAHSFPVVFDDVTLSSDTLATINSVTRSVSTTSTSIFTTSSNPNTNPNPATTATTTSTFIPNTLIDGNILKLSELGIKGSFSSKKRYSKVDLQDLVTYAKLYHIEIIPEIDMPAHSLSWGKVFSNLIVNCTKTAKKSSNILDVYPLNPSEPLVLIIIKEILIQISEIFPSKYLHVGGDEVYLGCWEESTSVLEYMKKHELKSTTELFRAFETEVFSIVRGLHRVPIVWQGTLDLGGMPSETKDNSNSSSGGSSGSSESNKAVVQPWKCWSGLAMRSALTAVQNDLDVVMSACWYLDFNEPWINFLTTNLLVEAEAREAENDKRTKSTSGRDKFNKDNYQSSSTTSKIAFHNHSKDRTINQTRMNPPSHSDAFRGGEGSIWTEHVDHSNFECRMWPRAAAIASQLWGQDINTFGYLEYESSTNHTENHSDSVAAGGSSSTAAGTRVYPHTHSRTQYGQAPANEIKYKNGVIADLNINATRHLYSNFVRIRYYLESLGLSSAPLTFHYIDHYKKYQNSVRVHSEQEAIVRIEQDMNAPLLLHTSPKSHLPAGTFSITAQCLGIPISMQRPMTSDRIKLAQLNVAEGSTGTRHAQMLTWLQSKAEEGVVAVGFCELNDWNKLHSDTDISKNYPVMTIRAANAGFPYSYIMTNSQPYHIGIMSVISFDIISEYGPPMFQRGVLHAYFRSIDLHILVCHLHAHSSIQREAEATSIGQMIVAPIREADPNARIAIMGDMNTLSRWDAQHHTQSKLVEFMLRNDNEVFQRFRKKFLYPPNHHHHSSDHMASASGNINSKSNPAVVTSESSTSTAQINYNPLDILMSFGFCDSCVEMCFSAQMSIDTSSSSEKDTSNSNHSQNMIKTKTKNEKNISSCYRTEYQNTRWSWSLAQNNSFSRCMQTQCSSTEPTLYNPEWPELQDKAPHPLIRLDYIFLSESIIQGSREGIKRKLLNNSVHNLLDVPIFTMVEKNDLTHTLSDHYPITTSWLDSNRQEICLY